MRIGLKQKLVPYLVVLISVTILFTNTLFAQDNIIRQKIQEALNSSWGDTTERLAEIGKPAVPLLLEILKDNEFPEFKFPAVVVEALGIIGDKTAVPVLLELLQNPTCQVKPFIIVALARIGDPAAEQAILANFEQAKSQDNPWQLEIALALLRVASESSRQKVKETTSYVQDLYQRAMWTFDEQLQEQIFQELNTSAFKNEEIVYAILASLLIDLEDTDLITKAIKYHQLVDEAGPRFTDGFKVLTETITPEIVESIFKFAENSEEIWPPAPPGLTEEERREFSQVPSLIRVAAVESLLTIRGVDIDRVTRAFEDISVEGLREIPLTVKFKPDKWNFEWKKTKAKDDEDDNDDEAEGKINCYLGNIPGGYSARDILAETILLNGKVSPSQKAKKGKTQAQIKKQHKDFIGEVLQVKFNKFEAIKSIGSIWPGKECDITITGRLNDDKPFRGIYRIKISKPEEDDEEDLGLLKSEE